ncbi:MAG: hypothetical protein EOP62_10120 [Sphingomonadales bacterium]|nr:MAG: hypothetical protein EOP62_10120 [Sphingomonadales bacterium]
MSNRAEHSGTGRRIALLLLACALLLKFPAGWMPEARAGGITIGWCNAVDAQAMTEGQALLDAALKDRPAPKQKPADQPCSFAAAAQPLAAADPLPELEPVASPEPLFITTLILFPGHGLAAPPPLSTGPPLLA